MALVVDEFYINYIDSYRKNKLNEWSELNQILFTSYDVFLFHCNSFYFRMMNKIVNNLIPTGIMNHLVEKYYTQQWKWTKVEKDPKVLNVDDLSFGFNIWLACCLLSFLAFIAEFIVKFIKVRLGKLQKVHPVLDSNEPVPRCYLRSELIQKFRVKSNKD